MKNYLITPTLLNQYEWIKDCPPDSLEKNLEDFHNIINRIYPPEVPDYILLGREFEHYIEKSVKTGKLGSDKFNEIREYFLGARFQQKTKYKIQVNNESFLLYGKIDALFHDKIIDLKTTSSFHIKKYKNSWQHKIYCYCKKIKDFSYIIVELKDRKIVDHHIIDYRVPSFKLLEGEIIEIIKEFREFINKNSNYKYSYENIFTQF